MENKIRVAPISQLYNLPGKNSQDKNKKQQKKDPPNQPKEDRAFVVELRKKLKRHVSRDQRIHRRK